MAGRLTWATTSPARLRTSKVGDEPAIKIYLRKKYFYDILGKDNIKEYVKSNNLKLNKEGDAIKVMEYYNNMLVSK